MEEEYSDYDFEEWEGDAYFIEKEDWKGLLELRKKRDLKRTDDLYAQQRYAEALILNKLYAEALDFIRPLYIKNHEFGFGVHEIMKSLQGLGKTEDDFQWVSKPRIVKLDQNLIESCLKFLSRKRKPTSCLSIYEYFLMNSDYIDFEQKELGLFLLDKTEIFEIYGDKKDAYSLEFKLNRK